MCMPHIHVSQAKTTDYHRRESAYQRLNAKLAVTITRAVGSMTMAWIFSLLALVSLPAVLTEAFSLHMFPHWLVSVGLIALVAWIAQTFLQLVLLSVIMVGQNVQQEASDVRSAKTFEDTEEIRSDVKMALDRLDEHTAGGIKTILDAIQSLRLAVSLKYV